MGPMRKTLSTALLLLWSTVCWAADTYNPTDNTLAIPLVQVGDAYYRDVRVSVGEVISVQQGAPSGVHDRYIAATNQLVIPKVFVNGAVYTNVTISVGKVHCVDCFSEAAKSYPLSQVVDQRNHFITVPSLATGDLDGDGLEDVVVGGWNSDSDTSYILIFIQQADGTLVDKTSQWLKSNVYGGSHHVFIADFDGDGRNDVFLPGFGDGQKEYARHSVVLWNSAGAFTRQDLSELTMSHGACLDDVNSDGRPDVLVGGGIDGSVGGIYINNGNRSFTLNQTALRDVTANNFFSTCAVAHEPNGNIVAIFGNTSNVENYRNNVVVFDSKLNVLSNKGLNRIDANRHSQDGSDLINTVPIDVNGDGHTDFVAVYNMLGPNGSAAFAGDLAARKVLLWSSAGTYVPAATLDNAFENMYYFSKTTIDDAPAIFFSGSNNQAAIYQLINGQLLPYKSQRFTDMAIKAGVPDPSQINFAIMCAIVYKNKNDVFMLQNINGIWYTQKM